MSVKDLINAISMGNAAETQEIFQSVMAEKISARLDDMRIEVAQNMFKEEVQIEEDLNLEDYSVEELEDFMMSEDFEQLDELSKKTLGNYIDKAKQSREYKFKDLPAYKNDDYFSTASKKREAGIAKAVDKLTKEDLNLEDFTLEELEDFMMSEDFEQLDEISGKVLGSYIQKARADMAAKYQHQRDVEAHPSVKKQSDKISDYSNRREYTKTGESKYRKQIEKARENKKKAIDKIDPNIRKTGEQGAAKRRRGIEKAVKKLSTGKLTN